MSTSLWVFSGDFNCLVVCHLRLHGLLPLGSSVHRISQQEYWSGLPFPSPGHLPHPGSEPRSPALQADSLPTEPPGEPMDGPLHLGFCLDAASPEALPWTVSAQQPSFIKSLFNTYSFSPMGQLVCIPVCILIDFSLLLLLFSFLLVKFSMFHEGKDSSLYYLIPNQPKQDLVENRDLIQFVKWIKCLMIEWMTKIYSVGHDTGVEGG